MGSDSWSTLSGHRSYSAGLEDALRPAAFKFMITLRSEFSAKSLVEALNAYKSEAIAAMKVLEAEVKAERGE